MPTSRRPISLPRRAIAALTLLLGAAPARAHAQELEAWVLPRGQLEVSGTGLYTYYDRRLGGGNPGLGAGFANPFQDIATRLTADTVAALNTDVRAFFTAQDRAVPGDLSAGTASLGLRADIRQTPLTVRYGLRDRLTVFGTVAFERRWTSALGPFLVGANVGVNTDRVRNAAVLAEVGEEFGALGGALFLPTRGSAVGDSLQALVRAALPDDSLTLPTRPVAFADFRATATLAAQLDAEELAAFDSLSNRRGYRLGDVQIGARYLLIPGPAEWPLPDRVTDLSFRTTVGLRARLPTGVSATSFLTELVPGGGHAGVGLDLLNDVFISRRWMVTAAASMDVLLPANVQRLAFGADRPFPPNTDVVTLRREPGAQIALNVVPRWRLTREMSFSGQYAFQSIGATAYSGGDGVVATPLESTGAYTAHAAGLGVRYSSLRAFALGQARVPFEVDAAFLSTFAGGGLAPDAGQLRFTARFFPHRGLLPRDTTPPPPPPVPVDTAATAPAAEADTKTPAPETPRPDAPTPAPPATPPVARPAEPARPPR